MAPAPGLDVDGVATVVRCVRPPPESRRIRRRHYRLGSLLRLHLVAALGGAKSPAQIARSAADAKAERDGGIGSCSSPRPASTAQA
ncbi:hypothetical protein [Streptomyces sp. P5_D11]